MYYLYSPTTKIAIVLDRQEISSRSHESTSVGKLGNGSRELEVLKLLIDVLPKENRVGETLGIQLLNFKGLCRAF